MLRVTDCNDLLLIIKSNTDHKIIYTVLLTIWEWAYRTNVLVKRVWFVGNEFTVQMHSDDCGRGCQHDPI